MRPCTIAHEMAARKRLPIKNVRFPSHRHHFEQCEVGLLRDEPDLGLEAERLVEQRAKATKPGIVPLESENAIVSREENLHAVGTFFHDQRGHIVVGADQCGDGLRLAKTDADGVLPLLTTPSQAQVNRVVRVAEARRP
jgi:hypothetical protein